MTRGYGAPPLGRRTALGVLALPALARPAPAQRAAAAWPDRPVRLVVPYGAGGAVDTLARVVAGRFAEVAGGQPIVVENRAGAGGTIAGAAVANARPDGTVLMMGDLSVNAVAAELYRGLGYDPRRSFTPVCHLVNLPLALVVRPGLPAADAAGLIEHARREDGRATFSHPGVGHVGHLTFELILRQAGVRMSAVTYRSGAEVLRSVVAGETDSTLSTVSTALPLAREGRVRILAVTSATELPSLPGVPPLSTTLPGFDAAVWHGILGPAGMAQEVTAAANQAFNAILLMPEVRDTLSRTQSATFVGGTPEAFGDLIAAEIERWTPLIRAAGIRPE